MGTVSEHYEELRRGVQMVAQLDCLVSLSKLASQEHYILPTMGEREAGLDRRRSRRCRGQAPLRRAHAPPFGFFFYLFMCGGTQMRLTKPTSASSGAAIPWSPRP